MTVLENCEDFIMVAADSASPSSGFQMFDVNSAISRTFSSPPAMPEKHTFKKRKPNNPHNSKFAAENDNKDKRIKVGADHGESKITNTNNTDQSLEKPDYIHVRARRGQATDSHSLAERVRREKISERMKYLQDLVPGCNKITGKAGMLDEIINYVRSLQRQVEFLSMKLATVNSSLDFDMDDVFDTELFPTLHHHHIVPYGELDTAINPSDMGLRRTLSAPVSVSMPQTFLHSSSFTQILPSSTLEDDFQNLYNLDFDQPSPTSFPSHLSTFHRSD